MLTIPPTTYSNDGWMTAGNQSFPFATATTGASVTASGSLQVVMSSVANIAVGQSVGLNLSALGAIAAGSLVTAVNTSTSTITLSAATTGSIAAATKLYFGTATPSGSAIEVQRTTFNAYMRASSAAAGCSGLVDIDAIVSDQTNIGKWRTDLGQASVDGVHPSAVLHQAAVNAGLITPSMFSIP